MRSSHTKEEGDEKCQPVSVEDLIPTPIGRATAAVMIHASPEEIWPWLVQIGSGRAGWYSYDWIDNGGRPSAVSILPEHQQLAPGDIVPAIPGATDAFIVAVVDPPFHLVLTVPDGLGGHQVSYEFLLQPLDDEHTRLVVRGAVSEKWPASIRPSSTESQPSIFIERVYWVLAHIPRPVKLGLAYVGHHLMESRMLHGIKRRAETTHRSKAEAA